MNHCISYDIKDKIYSYTHINKENPPKHKRKNFNTLEIFLGGVSSFGPVLSKRSHAMVVDRPCVAFVPRLCNKSSVARRWTSVSISRRRDSRLVTVRCRLRLPVYGKIFHLRNQFVENIIRCKNQKKNILFIKTWNNQNMYIFNIKIVSRYRNTDFFAVTYGASILPWINVSIFSCS